MSGRFIVLEGPDGAGTTFHCKMLAERLRQEGHDVLLTAEPTDGPIGTWVRLLIKEPSSDLSATALQLVFSADRAWHVESVIEPALRQGKIVISDRYALSTIIYGKNQGLEEEWLMHLGERFPKPDRIIVTLPPVEVCLERVARRKTHDMFEIEGTMRRIHKAYSDYAASHSDVTVIDTSGEKAAVSESIFALVSPFL